MRVLLATTIAAVLVLDVSAFVASGPISVLCSRKAVASGCRHVEVRSLSVGPKCSATGAEPHSGITDWVVANGGYVHPAVRPVSRGDAGVGLTLSAKVSAGQVLLALPPRLHVTLERLTGDDAAAAEMEVPSNKWDVKLALALLALMHKSKETAVAPQKADNANLKANTGGFGATPAAAPTRSTLEWASYFETLPASLDTLPIFYTGAQLREF